jgi:hypothetical protein
MDFVNLGFSVVKWGVVNIGAPLLVNKLVGGSRPAAPAAATTANPVRDSSPGTVNTSGGNSDAASSQNTLIIGAVALVAVIMLVKKK